MENERHHFATYTLQYIQTTRIAGNIVPRWSDAKLAVYVHHPYQMRFAACGIRYRRPGASVDDLADLVNSERSMRDIGISAQCANWYLLRRLCEYLFCSMREKSETIFSSFMNDFMYELMISLSVNYHRTLQNIIFWKYFLQWLLKYYNRSAKI